MDIDSYTIRRTLAVLQTCDDAVTFDRVAAINKGLDNLSILGEQKEGAQFDELWMKEFVAFICIAFMRNLVKGELKIVDMSPKTKGDA